MAKTTKCKLLDIEMPIDFICPASRNFGERFLCYNDCGFSPIRKEKPKRINTVQKELYW